MPPTAPTCWRVLDRALAGCQSGEFAAMATAPVHKGVINQAGVHFTGHTEYLAEKTGTPLVVMMLAGDTERGPLRVALATTHLPLEDVPAAITPEVLERTLRILARRPAQQIRHCRAAHPGRRAQSACGRGRLSGHARKSTIITPVLGQVAGRGHAAGRPASRRHHVHPARAGRGRRGARHVP